MTDIDFVAAFALGWLIGKATLAGLVVPSVNPKDARSHFHRWLEFTLAGFGAGMIGFLLVTWLRAHLAWHTEVLP